MRLVKRASDQSPAGAAYEEMVIAAAGAAAQGRIAPNDINGGAANDDDCIARLADEFDMGLEGAAHSAQSASMFVGRSWGAIEMVADALHKRETLTGEEIESIMSTAAIRERMKARAKAALEPVWRHD